METNDMLEKIKSNPELVRSVEEALRRNADAEELAGILANAEIDASVADDLLAECQRRQGAEIGFEDLNPEAYERISGGDGHRTGDCSSYYYKEPCSATVETNSWCMSTDYCVFFTMRYTSPRKQTTTY